MNAFGRKSRTPSMLPEKAPAKWKPTMQEPLPPVQCTSATITGSQCRSKSIPGGIRCMSHSSPADAREAQEKIEAQKLRLVGLIDPAIDAIEELLDAGTGEAVRLKAATEILDRAGMVKGQEITVTVQEDNRSAELVAEKLKAIRARREADQKREDEEVVEVTEVQEEE